jgi:hypothetical protein
LAGVARADCPDAAFSDQLRTMPATALAAPRNL